MNDMQMDIFGILEVNVAWDNLPHEHNLYNCTKESFEARHLSIGWNKTEDPLTVNQVGAV